MIKIFPPSLESNNRVSPEIFQTNSLTFLSHIRMLPAHQPTNVSEEESALDVVRICIGFGEFVVDPVIPAPFIDVILKHKIKLSKLRSREEIMCSRS
ncbi:hypothetical protein AVEN_188334-1 [Araneus ventricosus]|uniref:Uncharacterized protein n=1 Tax=Araneus ventricosus TaxID=182803 RepID=A0A4Y2MHQ1_ARAVE|nr:hypothetical protein AVEN_188334-1 [Araneus ventricosus]